MSGWFMPCPPPAGLGTETSYHIWVLRYTRRFYYYDMTDRGLASRGSTCDDATSRAMACIDGYCTIGDWPVPR